MRATNGYLFPPMLNTMQLPTELAVLNPASDPHLLPRLDAYYYRRPGNLERFGSSAFRAHLWLRGKARRLRASFAR